MHEVSHSQEQQEQQEQFWIAQDKLLGHITAVGGLQTYLDSLEPTPIPNTLSRINAVGCMDEGFTQPGSCNIAGCGVLHDFEETEKFLQSIGDIEQLTLWSHQGCGAAALAFEKYKANIGSLSPVLRSVVNASHNADEFGKKYVEALAEKLGTSAKDMPVEQLLRPHYQHLTRTLWYIGIKSAFNLTETPSLPRGFKISRPYVGKEDALAQVAIALQIAQGSHGVGIASLREYPFRLFAIGDRTQEEYSAQTLMGELQKIIEQDPQVARLVIIDGYNVPPVNT